MNIPFSIIIWEVHVTRALGHILCSGWCGFFPPSSPSYRTSPVAWPLWPLDWVWPCLATPAQRLFHSKSTCQCRCRSQASCLGTRSLIVNIPKIVRPRSLPHSRTWPRARSVLCSSQRNLPSEQCSRFRIHFLFCLRPMAPSPRSSRRTSPFSRAFDL